MQAATGVGGTALTGRRYNRRRAGGEVEWMTTLRSGPTPSLTVRTCGWSLKAR